MRTAVLLVAMLVLPACASAPRVPATAETIASLARERQIVAVHYHALGTPGPLHNGARLVHGSVTMAAPTGWIKDRFVQSLEARLGLQQIRNVPEPRFAYLERERAAPDARALKRTFERGLVFDFYSPWQYLPAAGGRLYRASEIQVRLLRLDDLSLLWADSCSFDAGHLPPPPLFLRLESVEKLYTPAALGRASGCADVLVARLLGDPER
ncbi:MAG: hypothetical protein DMD87_23165 [Candidatus Rokuibacteriota bacterium]|nr:MAG: hypothetical protein DMD87_23165 [Candidatus Rokubacteria bacterium]